MSEILLNSDDIEWEETDSYPEGTMRKILRDHEDARSFLLKLPPGFEMDVHTHTYGEEHLVLAGQYEEGGKTFGVGTYHYIPAKTDHGPYRSKNGAVVLVIWEG